MMAVEHWGQTAENKTPKQVISKTKSFPIRHLNTNFMWSQRAIPFERRRSLLKMFPSPYLEENLSKWDIGRADCDEVGPHAASAVSNVPLLGLWEHSQTL